MKESDDDTVHNSTNMIKGTDSDSQSLETNYAAKTVFEAKRNPLKRKQKSQGHIFKDLKKLLKTSIILVFFFLFLRSL